MQCNKKYHKLHNIFIFYSLKKYYITSCHSHGGILDKEQEAWLLMILLNAFPYIQFFCFLLSFWQRQLFRKGHIFAKVPESFKKRGVPVPETPCQMGKRSLRRLAYKVYFEIKDDHAELRNDGHIIATSMKSPHRGHLLGWPSSLQARWIASIKQSQNIYYWARPSGWEYSLQTWSRWTFPAVYGFILWLCLKFRKCLGVRGHKVIVKRLGFGVWVNTYCIPLLWGESQSSRVFK